MHVRYDLVLDPDENGEGETREQLNERVGVSDKTPQFEASATGYYLIEWFNDIRQTCRDLVDGVAVPIPPSEWKAWAELRGVVVRPAEYGILQAMHAAWRRAMSAEIAAARARAKDRGT